MLRQRLIDQTLLGRGPGKHAGGWWGNQQVLCHQIATGLGPVGPTNSCQSGLRTAPGWAGDMMDSLALLAAHVQRNIGQPERVPRQRDWQLAVRAPRQWELGVC